MLTSIADGRVLSRSKKFFRVSAISDGPPDLEQDKDVAAATIKQVYDDKRARVIQTAASTISILSCSMKGSVRGLRSMKSWGLLSRCRRPTSATGMACLSSCASSGS